MSGMADMSGAPGAVHHFPDPEALATALALDLAEMIRSAVARRGSCHLVFPGGRSARLALRKLAVVPAPWDRLHLYPSDERCVPPGHPDRNDLIGMELVRAIAGHRPVMHSIPAELGPAEGAAAYSALLATAPRFDVALLGVGPDGHTASLFPGMSACEESVDAVAVSGAPKPPAERVSIGLGRLRSATRKIVILSGAEKAPITSLVGSRSMLPIFQIQPTDWYVEASAVPLRQPTERRPDDGPASRRHV